MAIGRRGCFQGEGSKVSGHACFGVMEARTGPTGLVLPLDEWRPYKDVREPNPVCHLLAPASVRGGERGLVKTFNGGAAKSHGNNRTKSGGSAERFCHIAPELRAQMPVALVRRLCGGRCAAVARTWCPNRSALRSTYPTPNAGDSLTLAATWCPAKQIVLVQARKAAYDLLLAADLRAHREAMLRDKEEHGSVLLTARLTFIFSQVFILFPSGGGFLFLDPLFAAWAREGRVPPAGPGLT
jgi:hypothetical protein